LLEQGFDSGVVFDDFDGYEGEQDGCDVVDRACDKREYFAEIWRELDWAERRNADDNPKHPPPANVTKCERVACFTVPGSQEKPGLNIDFLHDFAGDEDIANGNKPPAERPSFRVVEITSFLMEIVIRSFKPAQEENDGGYECDTANDADYVFGIYIGDAGNVAEGDVADRSLKSALRAFPHEQHDTEHKRNPDEQDGVFGIGGVGFHGNAWLGERMGGREESGGGGGGREGGSGSGRCRLFKCSEFTRFSDEIFYYYAHLSEEDAFLFSHFSEEFSSNCSHKNTPNSEMFCNPLSNRVFCNEKRTLILGE